MKNIVNEKEIRGFRGDYYFLSNMYPCEIELSEGIVFKCSEALFQSAKVDGTPEVMKFAGINGYEAKKLGRSVKLPDNWSKTRVEYMFYAVAAKFMQNPDLAKKLIATGDKILIEENTWGDKFWGICNGEGKNMLGKILMKIREMFQKGEL